MATLDEIRLQQLLTPFNRTGVMSSSQAVPMINNIPMINTGAVYQDLQNTDLVNQIIAENQMKANQFNPSDFRSIFPSNVAPMPQEQKGITSTNQAQNFEFLKSAYEDQDEDAAQFLPGQEIEQYKTDRFGYRKEPNILQKLAQFIPFAGEKSLGRAIINQLPKMSPEAKNIRNFYGSQYGLDSIGRVNSGIMKNYNPVSGSDLLNKMTFGLVPKRRIGLSSAIQKKISKILGRKIAQTDISRARVKELKDLRDREIRDRADFGESLSSIGKSTFTGKGQAFAPKTNTFSGGKTKTTGGVPGGKYGSPK